MEQLVSQIIRKFDLSEDGQRLHITTDEYRYYFVAEGDCCAHAYILPPADEDVKAVIGQQVVRVTREAMDQQSGGEYGEVIDTEFISIQTHAGDLDFELRTEHNGYYCGYISFVEKEKVWPVFDEIREEALKEFWR
jgi:hypothetical protein